jgi:hypothetical protein
MRLNYLEASFMTGYLIAEKWGIEAGASVAALASSHEEDEVRIIENAPPFHKYDYLVNAGANYLLSDHLTVNVRYSYSIVPMRTLFSGYSYYYTGGQYNKVVGLAMLYRF